MKHILMSTVAVLALATGSAQAETAIEQMVAGLQAQGFTDIEVTTGPTQVQVEARGGGQKLEYVYDRFSGEVLMQEVGADDDEDDEPAVEIETSDDDFLDADEVEEGEDEGGSDGADGNRGHGNDEDGFDDDNHGSGHGSDGIPGGGRGEDDEDEGEDDSGHSRGHGGDDDDEDGDEDDSDEDDSGHGRGHGGDDDEN